MSILPAACEHYSSAVLACRVQWVLAVLPVLLERAERMWVFYFLTPITSESDEPNSNNTAQAFKSRFNPFLSLFSSSSGWSWQSRSPWWAWSRWASGAHTCFPHWYTQIYCRHSQLMKCYTGVWEDMMLAHWNENIINAHYFLLVK